MVLNQPPAILSCADLAPYLGICDRTVRRMVERGDFPPGTYIRVGRSKHAKHVRFLTAKLRAAGFLSDAAVVAPAAVTAEATEVRP